MKNKSFDCVEMKRKGAEAVYQKIASMTREQQLKYWRTGSAALNEQKQSADQRNEPSNPGSKILPSELK
jgi:hypothetical protein